jgi:hypothetical protein
MTNEASEFDRQDWEREVGLYPLVSVPRPVESELDVLSPQS